MASEDQRDVKHKKNMAGRLSVKWKINNGSNQIDRGIFNRMFPNGGIPGILAPVIF